eukprot:356165-Pelagomonas_calceolata.AAC.2
MRAYLCEGPCQGAVIVRLRQQQSLQSIRRHSVESTKEMEIKTIGLCVYVCVRATCWTSKPTTNQPIPPDQPIPTRSSSTTPTTPFKALDSTALKVATAGKQLQAFKTPTERQHNRPGGPFANTPGSTA